MVKTAVSLLLLALSVFASPLEDKIESFIGEKEYRIQKNLIGVLFKDKISFLRVDNSVDDIKVLKKLKDNGVLKLFYAKPQKLSLTFSTTENPLIFMRVINESLSSMGYNYFLTKRALKDYDGFLWEIIISTEHIVDPLILSKNLQERGCFLESVDRADKNKWIYVVDTDNIKIEALKIEANKTTELKKPIKPYWIDVESMKSISFSSKMADRWFPSIVFYDNKLHIVQDFQKDSATNRLKLKIPEDAKYAKVADLYTLDNIKRGISIYLIEKE